MECFSLRRGVKRRPSAGSMIVGNFDNCCAVVRTMREGENRREWRDEMKVPSDFAWQGEGVGGEVRAWIW